MLFSKHLFLFYFVIPQFLICPQEGDKQLILRVMLQILQYANCLEQNWLQLAFISIVVYIFETVLVYTMSKNIGNWHCLCQSSRKPMSVHDLFCPYSQMI